MRTADADAFRAWLPDLCRPRALLAVMAVTEIAVVVIAVAPSTEPLWSGGRFTAASLFAQWCALNGTAVLCRLTPRLDRLSLTASVWVAWFIPVLITAICAWLVYRIDIGGHFGATLPPGRDWIFVLGCAAIAAPLNAAMLRYFYVQQRWRTQVEAQSAAEVQALQARIRPHFLFNSLNTIVSLVKRNPEAAERAAENLADLFRAALGAHRDEGTLNDELILIERYLDIERLRLGERLRVRWQIDPELPENLPFPRLILQPLVENAVLHGVSRLDQGGEIVIAVAAREQRLEIGISNPAPPAPGPVINGHAQDNIAQRLAYHFGPASRMTTGYANGFYAVELSLPL